MAGNSSAPLEDYPIMSFSDDEELAPGFLPPHIQNQPVAVTPSPAPLTASTQNVPVTPSVTRHMPQPTYAYTRPITTVTTDLTRTSPPVSSMSWVTAASHLPLFSAAMVSSPMATLHPPSVAPYTPVTPGNQPYMPYYPMQPYGYMFPPAAGNPYAYPYPYAYPHVPPIQARWGTPGPTPVPSTGDRREAVRSRLTYYDNTPPAGNHNNPPGRDNPPAHPPVNLEDDEDLTRPYRPQAMAAYSRFTARMANAPLTPNLKIPSTVGKYDGTGDPDDHLSIFTAVGRLKDWPLLVWCHMFVQTLVGAARVWWDSLPPGSIGNWDEIVGNFRKNQCIHYLFEDGSHLDFNLSWSEGATICLSLSNMKKNHPKLEEILKKHLLLCLDTFRPTTIVEPTTDEYHDQQRPRRTRRRSQHFMALSSYPNVVLFVTFDVFLLGF